MIFTLPSCAPCNLLKKDLEQNPINNANILMYDMSQPVGDVVDLAVKYNVRGAPTTVVFKEDGSIYYIGTMIKTAAKLNETIIEAKNA